MQIFECLNCEKSNFLLKNIMTLFFITFFHIYSKLVTKRFIRLSSYLVLANLELVNDDVCFLMRITADLSSGGKSKLCERNMTAPPPS